jgi:transcriptional regulator with XRE-family HTH domain
MAKSIRDLRRENGFRNSREFADALGVSPSSMSRYDKDPMLIPVKVAWEMADLLGCSIDEVLGRKCVTSGKSQLQEDYDALSPETQALVCEFMEFVKAKDKKARNRTQARQALKFDRLCQFYEQMFYQSLYENGEFDDPVAFASSAHEREAFKAFVWQKAAEKRGGRIDKEDEGVVDAILVAYDRRHGSGGYLYEPTITIEYKGGLP